MSEKGLIVARRPLTKPPPFAEVPDLFPFTGTARTRRRINGVKLPIERQ